MGKVFDEIRQKERRGDYLGQTVQFMPHVVDLIKERILSTAEKEKADILLIEVGGTVGDVENELYIEACRQLKKTVGEENILYVHLTHIPILAGVKEQKSKPTQQSVNLLRERGIQPDIIIGRCKERITDSVKQKIATFCDVEEDAVITGLDVDSVYKIPFVFESEGITKIIREKLKIEVHPELDSWKDLITQEPEKTVNIAICGKYTALEDSYASVVEALNHAASHVHSVVNIKWVETTDIEKGKSAAEILKDIQGVIVPGGFGKRGAEGKVEIIKYCRENKIPYLGLCYGMQLAVIEFARNVCDLKDANSSEIDNETKHPVIDLLPEQKDVKDKGATMRLGGHDILIKTGTKAHDMFKDVARLRFRHRWEVNPEFVDLLAKKGLVFSGTNKDKRIMQILELQDHPFFMATQSHPELTSGLDKPSKFFFEFLKAAVQKRKVEVKI